MSSTLRCPLLFVLCLLPLPTHPFPCAPQELLPFPSNFPAPQAAHSPAESLAVPLAGTEPAAGWLQRAELPAPISTPGCGSSSSRPWLACRMSQGAGCSLWFPVTFCVCKSQDSLPWKWTMYHSRKAYLPDFTKALIMMEITFSEPVLNEHGKYLIANWFKSFLFIFF